MKARELTKKVVKKSVKTAAKPKPKAKAKATPKAVVKKTTEKANKKIAQKILERHRLRLKQEANNKKTTNKKTVKKPEAKPEAKPKKIIERKHLTRSTKPMQQETVKVKNPRAKLIAKSGGPGSVELRKAANAAFAAHLAREAARARAAKGIVTQKLTIKIPKQKVLALQVRTVEDPEWGILKSFAINDYTSQKQLDEYTKELKELQVGWIVSNYFGSNASYKIDVVVQPSRVVEY